jgi:endopeptidase Clp ATP-binding regulatory subunit ClpX
MNESSEKIPDPKELEKEIGEFLAKKFKNNVKVVSPVVMPQELAVDTTEQSHKPKQQIKFDLLPEELISYLDQYVVKQDEAKAILATKICTHFNRIKKDQSRPADMSDMVGRIKNNVLMLGPTGVGKTYIIKLIASKIGVPFVKGDATKFSETGYVGGDIEDLVRDLVREANDDIDLAQFGIIYIDEIDKIAGSRNHIGADVSRTGVQRALLKPLEETEVDLKVPHDPISMLQEIERYRKTGERNKRVINTRNILFIMSGAFSELPDIVRRRVNEQGIGFGAQLSHPQESTGYLQHVRSEDLINFGFESEFVGRLPVRAVFEQLDRDDLFEILKNPNNPIILGKKLDFAAYGIAAKFDITALELFASRAYEENTGARGLVSAVERALLLFEKKLPSTRIRKFPVTADVIKSPETALQQMIEDSQTDKLDQRFDALTRQEIASIRSYLQDNLKGFADKYSLTLTPSRIEIVAKYYAGHIMDVGKAISNIKSRYDDVKKIELYFYKNYDINIVLEEDAIDYIIDAFVTNNRHLDDIYEDLSKNFEHGLKLVREKTGKNRFFITRDALETPEQFIKNMLVQDITPATSFKDNIRDNS